MVLFSSPHSTVPPAPPAVTRPVTAEVELGITAKMRANDARLTEKTLHLSTAPEPLSALTARLAKETGVELAVGTVPGLSSLLADPLICAQLRGVTLGNALDSLCCGLSLRGARWHWAQSGERGAYCYTLWPPRTLAALRAQMRRRIDAEFDARFDAFLHGDHRSIGTAEVVTPRLNSEPDIHSLSSADQTVFVQAGIGWLNEMKAPDVSALRDGNARVWIASPPPDAPLATRFLAVSRDSGVLVPTLNFLEIQNRPDGSMPMTTVELINHDVANRKWLTYFSAFWMFGEDVRTNASTGAKPAAAKPEKRIEKVLQQLADSLPVSCFAIYPAGETPEMPKVSCSLATLRELLAYLNRSPLRWQHKWHGPVLLLRDPTDAFRFWQETPQTSGKQATGETQ